MEEPLRPALSSLLEPPGRALRPAPFRGPFCDECKCSRSALRNTTATSHVWLLTTSNMARVTEDLNLGCHSMLIY